MSISENIKAINKKIKLNKTRYYLDRQTATISVLSPADVSKYDIFTGKGVLPENDFLEKAATKKDLNIDL